MLRSAQAAAGWPCKEGEEAAFPNSTLQQRAPGRAPQHLLTQLQQQEQGQGLAARHAAAQSSHCAQDMPAGPQVALMKVDAAAEAESQW